MYYHREIIRISCPQILGVWTAKEAVMAQKTIERHI
jgi:hypothetical protein